MIELLKKFFGFVLLMVVVGFFYNSQSAYGCTPPSGRSIDPMDHYDNVDIIFVGTIRDIYTQNKSHLIRVESNKIIKGTTTSREVAITTPDSSAMCGYDLSSIKKNEIWLFYGIKSNDGTYRISNIYPNIKFPSIEEGYKYTDKTFSMNDVSCAEIYAPVCGEIVVNCIQAPCPPEKLSFPNLCEAQKYGVKNTTDGVCSAQTITNTGSTGSLITTGSTWQSVTFTLLDKIKWAYSQGITSFDTIEGFKPDDFISRQQASKMLVSFSKSILGKDYFDTIQDTNCRFADDNLFHESLAGYIKTACEQNIFVGAYNNANGIYFYPYETFTRGQGIAVMMRVLYGKLSEDIVPWYKNYLDKMKELTPDMYWDIDFEKHITRGEIVNRMYEVHKAYIIGK